MGGLLAGLGFYSASSLAWAQSVDQLTEEDCEAALRDGAGESLGEGSAARSLASFASWLCESEQASAEGALLRAAFNGIDISWFTLLRSPFFEGPAGGDGFAARRQRFCSETKSLQRGTEAFREYALGAASVVSESRSECRGRTGLRAWLTPSGDRDEFRLDVVLRAAEGEARRVRVLSDGVKTVNVRCVPSLAGQPLPAEGLAATCQRESNQPFWIHVETSEGAASLRNSAVGEIGERSSRLRLESSHPSQTQGEPLRFQVRQPGAHTVRLHFVRVDSNPTAASQTGSAQILEVATPGGPVQFHYENDVHGLWTPPIELDADSRLELRLHCESACWGFEIDLVETLFP